MSQKRSDIYNLLTLLPKRPHEFYYRMMVRLERFQEKTNPKPYTYAVQPFAEMVDTLSQYLQQDLHLFLNEASLQEIEASIQAAIENIPAQSPFPRVHNSDFTFGRALYILCRALQPENIIETGVAYGVSSSYILQALATNQKGALHSIDLPPSLNPGTEHYVGFLIPQNLRQRWTLYSGVSRYILPNLVKKLGKLDIFIHDSSHTFANMRGEFQTVTPYLAPFSALVSDDVERNAALGWWIEQNKPPYWSVVSQAEKKSLFGVSVFNRKSNV